MPDPQALRRIEASLCGTEADPMSSAFINAQIDRREALGRLQPICGNCGTRQVQLRFWCDVPAQWRCRECRHEWEMDL